MDMVDPISEPRTNRRPRFLITIDTEGDNLWSKPRIITTRNAEFLPRFQSLCESHGLKPTYLTAYELANSTSFQEFGKDLLRRKTGEIGMHLHAWNTPPLVPLTQDDLLFQPYLTEYPELVMEQKISVLTQLLEDKFGEKMLSHRAGRWSFNEVYARMLVTAGYRVDCSVTPFISWKRQLGDPGGKGGTDYSQFPSQPYFLDLGAISHPGDSPLLELPMTIVPSRRIAVSWLGHRLNEFSMTQRALNRFFPSVYWLRPNRGNGHNLMRIVEDAVQNKRPYVEFMLHSSELMPGGSPTFRTAHDVERLYADLEMLFDSARATCTAATLREFSEEVLGESRFRARGRIISR